MLTFQKNLLKLFRSDRHLDPQAAIYYVTEQCNLNCVYCEDFGSHRNIHKQPPLEITDVFQILRVIRSGVNALMLTGGEPLTHPGIDDVVRYAKMDLNFNELTLISNGLLLHKHEVMLTMVDRLIISLDTLDIELLSNTTGISPAAAQTILDNITRFAGLQTKYGYRMIINSVLTPNTLPQAASLIDFCKNNQLLISFSPQAVNNWPRYELTVSQEYRQFIENLQKLKQAGAPIFGSDAYLRTLASFQPYDCYPTLVPRIYPNGELCYPCRPLEKAANGQGGRPVNLLNSRNWTEAWDAANQAYGQPPRTCHSCFQQCHAEPSLMQSQPLEFLFEWAHYPASRSGNLPTYSPG